MAIQQAKKLLKSVELRTHILLLAIPSWGLTLGLLNKFTFSRLRGVSELVLAEEEEGYLPGEDWGEG